MPEPPPKKACTLRSKEVFESATVELIVGPNRQVMTVHKGLLCAASPVFKAALTGNFEEATTNKIKLPAEDPAVISNFLEWLYFNRIGSETTSITLTHKDIEKLYLFADARQIPSLMDQAINAWRQRFLASWAISSKPNHVWDNSVETLKIRNLIADVMAHVMEPSHFADKHHDIHCKAFLSAVLRVTTNKAFIRPRDGKSWLTRLDMCKYHEHKPEEPCSQPSTLPSMW